ncbi:hypothetical protein [Dactylosporangium sp. NPDC005555]|uniref:hypothetical protein n=1 Tax=Dactylosporangium sp. NPDC005555 TaxID=3154889 RepID=UPI0033A86B49
MKRRNLLTAAAVGGIGAVLAASGAGAATIAGDANGFSPEVAAAAAAPDTAVEPAGGAGLFDVDPDQGGISQSGDVAVVGDVTVMSEDWGF